MGKSWEKLMKTKEKKKEALFNTAYELFTTKGITSTTISDIVEKAEVAKGTFYLYFTNKYDIKNKLVVHKTQELFDAAGAALEKEQIHGLEDQMIFLIDHLINHLKDDRALLNFISKNLVMGALRSALLTGENSDREIYNHFLELVAADDYEYKDVDVMLFTIVELAGSAGYNSMMYEEPIPIDDYKPFLYRTVRLIIKSHRADAKMELKI